MSKLTVDEEYLKYINIDERRSPYMVIPYAIWFCTQLTTTEKVLLVEIDSLCRNGECYASNEYLARFCQCGVTKVSQTISKLVDLELIEIVSFDGRQRILKSNLTACINESINNLIAKNSVTKNVNQTYKKCKADLQKVKSINNNIYNISNNIIKHNNSNIDNNSYSEYTTIKDNDNIIKNNAIVNDTLEIETPTEGFNSKEEVKIGAEVLGKKQQKKPSKKIIKKGNGLIREKEDIKGDSEPALAEPTAQLFATTKKSAKDTKNSSILIKLKSRIDKYNYNEDINKALYVWLDILKDNKKLISAAQLDLALEQINDLLKQKKTTAQIIQIIKDASVSAYTNFKWCIPKEPTTKQINGNPYSSSKRTYDLERNHDPATMTEDDIAYWENRRISALPLEERKKEIAKTLIMDKKY